jgi:hypothetical protein
LRLISENTVNVREDAVVGTVVTQVQVVDEDASAVGAPLTFLESFGGRGDLGVDAATGVITTRRRLDFETVAGYAFFLRVQQGDAIPVGFIIFVEVVDVNEAPVILAPRSNVNVAEDAQTGTVVFTVVTEDPDVTAAFRRVKLQMVTEAPLVLNASTGQARLAGRLDFETRASYSVLLLASDPLDARLSTLVALQLVVLDVNEGAPIVLPASFSAREDAPVGTVLGIIVAVDLDGPGNQLSYRIVSGSPALRIPVASVPEVVLGLPLNAEEATLLTAVVEVSDSGVPPLSTRANVTLQVDDVNEFDPVFAAGPLHFATVNAGTPGGTTVADLAASDGDASDPTLAFELFLPTPGLPYALLTSTRNVARLFLSRTATPSDSATLLLVASDGTRKATVAIVITVV